MPLIFNATCKTCATEGAPAEARFCPTCGRRRGWAETGRGRRRAAALVTLAILLLAAGVVASLSNARNVSVAPAAVVARAPPRVEPASGAERSHPVSPPTSVVEREPEPTPPPAVAARPGDTDLTVDPLAVYAGGPTADRLTLRGVRVGLPAADVPAALVAERSPGRLKDAAGNEYVVDGGGSIAEVRVNESAVLNRLAIDGTHALLARFGDPDRRPLDVGAQMFALEYGRRGITVRWDDGVGRVDQVTLARPWVPAR